MSTDPLSQLHKGKCHGQVSLNKRMTCTQQTIHITYDQRSQHTPQPILQIKQGGPKLINTL
jgi:hypothetical protein